MDYKNKLQTNNTALEGNNLDLQTILNTINSLPEVGSGESVNLDAEITAQDAVIAQIQSALEGKAAGGGASVDTCTLRITSSGNPVYVNYSHINDSIIECVQGSCTNITSLTCHNVPCGSIVGLEGVFISIAQITVDGESITTFYDSVGWFIVPNKKDEIIDVTLVVN